MLKMKKLMCIHRIGANILNRARASTHLHPTLSAGALPQHHIWISTSRDIFSNLALEEYIYDNINMNKDNILLIWKNEPCIVIGRHQNPWDECNLPEAKKYNIHIARRQSGGGTVYHDL